MGAGAPAVAIACALLGALGIARTAFSRIARKRAREHVTLLEQLIGLIRERGALPPPPASAGGDA